jgi:hypothetical protein
MSYHKGKYAQRYSDRRAQSRDDLHGLFGMYTHDRMRSREQDLSSQVRTVKDRDMTSEKLREKFELMMPRLLALIERSSNKLQGVGEEIVKMYKEGRDWDVMFSVGKVAMEALVSMVEEKEALNTIKKPDFESSSPILSRTRESSHYYSNRPVGLKDSGLKQPTSFITQDSRPSPAARLPGGLFTSPSTHYSTHKSISFKESVIPANSRVHIETKSIRRESAGDSRETPEQIEKRIDEYRRTLGIGPGGGAKVEEMMARKSRDGQLMERPMAMSTDRKYPDHQEHISSRYPSYQSYSKSRVEYSNEDRDRSTRELLNNKPDKVTSEFQSRKYPRDVEIPKREDYQSSREPSQRIQYDSIPSSKLDPKTKVTTVPTNPPQQPVSTKSTDNNLQIEVVGDDENIEQPSEDYQEKEIQRNFVCDASNQLSRKNTQEIIVAEEEKKNDKVERKRSSNIPQNIREQIQNIGSLSRPNDKSIKFSKKGPLNSSVQHTPSASGVIPIDTINSREIVDRINPEVEHTDCEERVERKLNFIRKPSKNDDDQPAGQNANFQDNPRPTGSTKESVIQANQSELQDSGIYTNLDPKKNSTNGDQIYIENIPVGSMTFGNGVAFGNFNKPTKMNEQSVQTIGQSNPVDAQTSTDDIIPAPKPAVSTRLMQTDESQIKQSLPNNASQSLAHSSVVVNPADANSIRSYMNRLLWDVRDRELDTHSKITQFYKQRQKINSSVMHSQDILNVSSRLFPEYYPELNRSRSRGTRDVSKGEIGSNHKSANYSPLASIHRPKEVHHVKPYAYRSAREHSNSGKQTNPSDLKSSRGDPSRVHPSIDRSSARHANHDNVHFNIPQSNNAPASNPRAQFNRSIYEIKEVPENAARSARQTVSSRDLHENSSSQPAHPLFPIDRNPYPNKVRLENKPSRVLRDQLTRFNC